MRRFYFPVLCILFLIFPMVIGCSDSSSSSNQNEVEAVAADRLEDTQGTEGKVRNAEELPGSKDTHTEPESAFTPAFQHTWEPEPPISSGLFLEVLSEGDNALTVNVWATGLEDVFGLAFHLRHNPNVLLFEEAETEPILEQDGGGVESRTVLRSSPGFVRYGTVRIHEISGYGQGANLTGVDVGKSMVGSFHYKILRGGNAGLHIPVEGRDHRTSELEQLSLTVGGGMLRIEEVTP